MKPTHFAKILLTLTVLSLAGPALADYKRDYGNAMKAIQGENWQKAANDLQNAIGEQPGSAERVRLYGMRFDVYIPHYYLGEALFRQGDCAGAVAAWSESLSRGIIQSQPQFAEMQGNMSSCSGSVVDVSAIAATASDAIDSLKSAAESLLQLKTDPLMGSTWSRFESDQTNAQRQATQLGSRLQQAQADKDADAISAIENEATQGAANINGLIAQARSALEDNRVAANRARQDMLRAASRARVADDKNSPDQRVKDVKRELLALVAESDQLGSNASVDKYQGLTRSIRSKEREFTVAIQEWEAGQQAQQQEVARRTPPAGLKQAVEAYFSGNYAQAATLADPNTFKESRERIQAHLFRAAARFHLYSLQGEADRRLLQQVQNDIRSIKRLDKDFSPYLAAFPPKFMTLFNGT